MVLYLCGHRYRTQLEEGVLAFLGFKPDDTVCGQPPSNGDHICSRLSTGARWATATASIDFGGKRGRGMCRADVRALDDYDRRRAESHALKIALFKAARDLRGDVPPVGESLNGVPMAVDSPAGESYVDTPTPWGSLSGMRPTKLAMRLIAEQGEARARRVLRQRYLVREDRAALAVEAASHGLAVKNGLPPRSVGLYVGIPFCPSRCTYCSFISASTGASSGLVEPYLRALYAEIERRGALAAELSLIPDTLYIGGGTPTVLSAAQLDGLLSALETHFDLSALRELTVEAGRPDTIDEEKLAALAAHGVGRISINPQSMEPAVLARVARPHSPEDVERAYRMARDAGFRYINMDVIAGLPGDGRAGFRRTIERLLALAPENLTVHTLALKRGSAMAGDSGIGLYHRRDSDAPFPDEVAAMLADTEPLLREAGYGAYYLYRQKYMTAALENVGYALPGSECIYNICIMEELQSILSLGAGGITKLVDERRITRRGNPKYPMEYIRYDASASDEAIRGFFAHNGTIERTSD